MELVGENPKGKKLVRVDGPHEAAIFEVTLPFLSFNNRRVRQELRQTDDNHAWPVTIAVGSRALLFAAAEMESRADGLERHIKVIQFSDPQPEPEVEVLRYMAATIREPRPQLST